MRIGMIGLGKMGSALAERLRHGGVEVVGYDRDPSLGDVSSLPDVVSRLPAPRIVWTMLPAGEATRTTIGALAGMLERGDLVVDGANSNFRDSMLRAGELAERGIAFADVGVSGGIWGREAGFCLMAGGTGETVRRLQPVFDALASEGGFVHVGPAGSGHFVKMVHNGIEYAAMQALGEGLELMHQIPDFPSLDLAAICEAWRHGSVVRSWLLDLVTRALHADPALEGVRGFVEDSGEGRWTVHEAIRMGVPVPAIAGALFARFDSRREDAFSMRVLATLRREFGGHAVQE